MDQWRSAKNDPPKIGERVIATSGRFVGEAYMLQGGEWYRHSGISWGRALGLRVTHWMPMPKASGEEHYTDL